MKAFFLFASMCLGGDVESKLGNDDWVTREAASQQLKKLGWLAYPFLLPLEKSESPEVRLRVEALLKPYYSTRLTLRVMKFLTDEEEFSEEQMADFFSDHKLRYAAKKYCEKIGVVSNYYWAIWNDIETYNQFDLFSNCATNSRSWIAENILNKKKP